MLGGTVVDDDGLTISTNNTYIFNVTHNTIVSINVVHVSFIIISVMYHDD